MTCETTAAEQWTDPFAMGESDIRFLINRPKKLPGCCIFFCMDGEAEVGIDILTYRIKPGNLAVLLPGSFLALSQASGNFSLQYIYLSDTLFGEATYQLPADFFRFLKEHPVLYMDREQTRFLNKWLELLSIVYTDRDHQFGERIIKNQMQCFFWEFYDKMYRFVGKSRQKTRRQDELFHDFMLLVKTHCHTNREVDFYAGKLCISPRYLSYVCTMNATGESAKRLIDRMTILEIKILLETTRLPVQKIAEQMHFPDQSYLGRFFKRYTGESPLAYRRKKSKEQGNG